MLTLERYQMALNAIAALETSIDLQLTLASMVIDAMDGAVVDDQSNASICDQYTRIRLKLEEIRFERNRLMEYAILLKAMLLQHFKPVTEEEEPCERLSTNI